MQNDIQPRIVTIREKILVGMSLRMSLADNRTGELWQHFMPRRKEITGTVSTDLYSLQSHPHGYWASFSPECVFEKWALAEVNSFLVPVPDDMEMFMLPKGQYAVFSYKGPSTDTSIFRYIFNEWLPTSGYRLDDRPHFEVLGEKYSNTSPDSEEEIWIPVIAL